MTLPMNTVFEGAYRDPRLSEDSVAALKSLYLGLATEVTNGMTETEIIDTTHEMMCRGWAAIVEDDNGPRLELTKAGRRFVRKQGKGRKLFRP